MKSIHRRGAGPYFDRGIPTCLQTHVLSPHFLSVFHFILINVLEAVVYLSRQGAPEVQTEMPSLTWFKAVAFTCCLVSVLITNKRNFKKTNTYVTICRTQTREKGEKFITKVVHRKSRKLNLNFVLVRSGNPRCFSRPGGPPCNGYGGRLRTKGMPVQVLCIWKGSELCHFGL